MNERPLKSRVIAPVAAPGKTIDGFCRRWAIVEMALFGSLARGDVRENSDADVLVTFLPGTSRTVADRAAIEAELREMFGREVDVVQADLVVNPFRRHNILLDKKVLFPPTSSGDEIRDGAERFPRDVGLLWDIVRTAGLMAEATHGKSLDDYKANWILRAAVERCLITIGEASRGFSEAFRAAHPQIPWTGIISERNILVHQYTPINDDEVWRIATVEVPRLLAELRPLLPSPP